MYIQTHINNQVFKTKVLTNKEDIKLGMMGKKFTSQFDALLFVMNTPSSSFWMKNCIVPLDVIFIENGKITKIHHNCPPCLQNEKKFQQKIYTSATPSKFKILLLFEQSSVTYASMYQVF